ncbi:MAG: hypothetical protein WC222_06055 [Parachlamydiales bacterium]|jgi:hypothetical protein
MSDPYLDPSYTPPSIPSGSEANDTPVTTTSPTPPPSSSSALGEQDVIESSGGPSSSQSLLLLFDQPDLEIPLNIYAQTISKSLNDFKKQDRANDVENPSLTRDYYAQVVEMCKLSRKQRTRLKDNYQDWKKLVEKQNEQGTIMNSASTVYNPQVPADQAAVDAFRTAIQNYNLTGDQVAFDAAVAAYNGHFATANPGIQTYKDAALLYNEQVDQNNLKIDDLNETRAKFVPPLTPIPHQAYVLVEEPVTPFPAGPYTIPVADPTVDRNVIATIPTIPEPPPPILNTQDTTLEGDQIKGIDRIIFSRKMLDSKQNNVDFINYFLRGTKPQIVDSYVDKHPEPKSGGGNAAAVGLGSTMFGLNSPLLEGQVSLQVMQAALSKIGLPPFVNQGDATFAQESFKQDVIEAGISLFFLAAKQAGVATTVRFDNELGKLRPGGDTANVLLASELVNVANNFKDKGSEIINAIAAELVGGSDLLGQLSPEDQAAAAQVVAGLLQSSLATFALQALSIALNSPGLVPQVIGNAVPQFASSLTSPSTADLLNQSLREGTVQQDLKNSLIDSLLKTEGANRRDITRAANNAVDQTSGPVDNVDKFFSDLKDRLVSEGIREDQLREAINNAVISVNNQLPSPTTSATELDRTSGVEVNGTSFLASQTGQRVLSSSGLDAGDLRAILNSASDLATSTTIRGIRDSVIQQSLIQGNSIGQSILVGNRLSEEVIDASVNSARQNFDNINSSILKQSLEQTLLQAQLSKEAANTTSIQVSQNLADNLGQVQSEQEARAFIQKELVDKFGIQNDVAARAALNADFKINQTGEQLLNGIGANSLLSPTDLAESLVNVATRELSKTLPADKAKSISDDIALKVVGRQPTTNLDQISLDSTPTSIVRIISDTTKNLEKFQDNTIAEAQSKDFRDAMSPNVDVYTLTREVLDPANLYIRSKFEGPQYDRKDPSFRASIDIII